MNASRSVAGLPFAKGELAAERYQHGAAEYSGPVGLSLRSNMSWALVGNIIYAGTQWGLLILLTKLFDPSQFGRYALAASIVIPVFSTSTLQLRAIQVSAVDTTVQFADYLSVRLATNILAFTCLIALVMCRVLSPQMSSLVILLGLNQAVMLVKDIYQGAMQRHERMDLVAVSNVLQGVLSVAAAAGTAYVTGNLQLTVTAMLVARIFVFVTYDIPRSSTLRSNGGALVKTIEVCTVWSGSRCRSLVRNAAPLGVTMLLLSVYPNIPRYFLATYCGEAYVGYFAAVATLMSVQDLIVIPLGEAAIRKLSLFYATNKIAYVRLLSGLMGVGVIIGAVGVAAAWRFGHPLLPLLFRKEYASFVEILVWLMAARLVLNIQCFMGYSITAAGKYSAQVWIWGLAVAAMLVASWLLIPTRSALGAAWALFIGACIATGASIVVIAGALRSSTSPHPAILRVNV